MHQEHAAGCLQVWTPYWASMFRQPGMPPHWSAHGTAEEQWAAFKSVVPFQEKRNAIVYLSNNCDAKSGRVQVLRELQQLLKDKNSSLQVHSYGQCDRNVDAAALNAFQAGSHPNDKVELFSHYKFCVVRMHVVCM